MLNVRDLPSRGRSFQLNGESLKMYRIDRRFSFILSVVLYIWIFSCRIVASDASSGKRVALDSDDVLIYGKQHMHEFRTAHWVRGLKQVDSAPTPDGSNIYFILAEHRTRRPDILQKFKFYEGGWNITSKHYWASVGFTGAPAFILAVLWFIAFGFALLVLCCCRRWIKGACEGLHSCWVSLLLLIVFTCAAIVGCILLSTGQDKFHHKISHTLDFVVHQSEFTVGNLRNITEYLAHAKTISVDQHFIPLDDKQKIDKLNKDLNEAANELQAKTADNADKIRKALTAV